MVHIGVVSYSIYLWQMLFLAPENHSWTGRFPLNLGCVLLAAHLSYWLVEKPFLNVRNRFRLGTVSRTDAVRSSNPELSHVE